MQATAEEETPALATYHLHMQAISHHGGRNGRSAVACAAYRAGQVLQDRKTVLCHVPVVLEIDLLVLQTAPEALSARELLPARFWARSSRSPPNPNSTRWLLSTVQGESRLLGTCGEDKLGTQQLVKGRAVGS